MIGVTLMKKFTAAILALIFIFTFIGCAKTEEPRNYDADIIADALNSKLSFGEALEKSTADIAYTVYGISPELCTKAALYIGSGATADEIAVFNCIDKASADSVYEAVQDRIHYLHDGYMSYGPEEVDKIDSAAVISAENTVILCICNNPDNAESVVDSASK